MWLPNISVDHHGDWMNTCFKHWLSYNVIEITLQYYVTYWILCYNVP